MYDEIPVVVRYQQDDVTCQFMVPGADGLEILSLMLSRKMDWDQGVTQLMSILAEFVPPQLLPTIEQSYAAASQCVDILTGVAY